MRLVLETRKVTVMATLTERDSVLMPVLEGTSIVVTSKSMCENKQHIQLIHT
jgi:hypothetical protein